MLLPDLPPEIILVIADALHKERDINALALCDRHLYAILNPYLYRHNVKWHNSSSLFWAVRYCETNTVRHALDHGGADVNVREGRVSLNDGTPLYKMFDFLRATRLPRLDEIRCPKSDTETEPGGVDALLMLLLERGADVNAATRTRMTPFRRAVWMADERLVRLLLAKGADLKARDCYGNTVLHTAAEGGDENIVRFLIEQGLSVHDTNNYGQTPLHKASYEAQEMSARVLIENVADVDAQDTAGATPLHRAASNSRFDGQEIRAIIELLLDNGADLETSDIEGCTPLHGIPRHGHFESLALFLIQKGARIDVRDKHGRTIYQDAQRRKMTRLIERLHRRSPRLART
jgi:ankyrin repeat protein